jgi:hypothetical protein
LAAQWFDGSAAVVLLLVLYGNLNGSLALGELLPIISLFCFIHFESIVFNLVTAEFV